MERYEEATVEKQDTSVAPKLSRCMHMDKHRDLNGRELEAKYLAIKMTDFRIFRHLTTPRKTPAPSKDTL